MFKNVTVTRDDIGPFMRQYAEENDIMSAPRRMLVGSFHDIKLLLATPLLRWYLAHGLIVDRVYQVVEYEPHPCFQRFGESVSAARRAGDSDPEKAIIADTMKLLGNSGYGKTVTNVDRHHDVKYCTEVGTSALINNKRFRQLDVVTDDAYEIEMNKRVVNTPFPSTSVSSSTSTPNSACCNSIMTLSTGTSNVRCFSTVKWTQTQPTLHLPVIPSMISSLPSTANTTSGTGLNGSRPNAVTITGKNTSAPV